jgi:hypothetical protein
VTASSPDRAKEFRGDPLFRHRGNSPEWMVKFFCESRRRFTHSHIIIATIERLPRLRHCTPQIPRHQHCTTKFSCTAKRPRCATVDDDSPTGAHPPPSSPGHRASIRRQTQRRLGLSHRNSGNRMLNEELAAVRPRMLTDQLAGKDNQGDSEVH